MTQFILMMNLPTLLQGYRMRQSSKEHLTYSDLLSLTLDIEGTNH